MRPKNLCKNTNLCENNLNIPRKYMPQIENKYLDEYLKFIKKYYKIKKQSIPVRKLKATQNELSEKAIRRTQKKIKKKKFNPDPIIVSRDNYILDGHHRWGSYRDCEVNPSLCKLKKKSFKIKTYKINAPIKQLLRKTKKFKNINYKDIH